MIMRPLVIAVCAGGVFVATTSARAEDRFAVVIGNNLGETGEAPLRYAEADAARVASVLLDIGGVRAENLVLLQGQDGGAVRRALIAVNERIRRGRPKQAVLVVYYSGHADEVALHLGDTSLSLDEVRGLVQGSAAAFRLSIVDACRSGGLTRVKGGTIVPRTRVLVYDDAVGEGTVFLTATSANEDAQESETIRGSFFTHFLVTGLLGAADDNRDGAVDLNEAYRFAYAYTLRATSRTLGGLQHPTFQQNLKGKGEVVLTRWSAKANRAFFTFPAAQSWLLMRDSDQGPIVAEITAQAANRTVSVRPGTYFVLGRAPTAVLEGTVEAGANTRIVVGDLDLARTEYAQLVRKGGVRGPTLVHGPSAGYQMRTGLEGNSGICQGAFGSYAAELPAITIAGRVGYCAGTFRFRESDGTNDELDFELRIHRAVDVGPVTLHAGVGAALTILRQRVTITSRLNQTTTEVREERSSVGTHGDIGVGVQYSLPWGMYAGVDGHAMVYLYDVQQPDLDRALEATFAARLSAAIGKRF